MFNRIPLVAGRLDGVKLAFGSQSGEDDVYESHKYSTSSGIPVEIVHRSFQLWRCRSVYQVD